MLKRVRRELPASYLKVCAMLVPREMRAEHSGGVKAMSDEQLEAAVEILQSMIDQKLAGENAKLVEGVAEDPEIPHRRHPTLPRLGRRKAIRNVGQDMGSESESANS